MGVIGLPQTCYSKAYSSYRVYIKCFGIATNLLLEAFGKIAFFKLYPTNKPSGVIPEDRYDNKNRNLHISALKFL